MSLTYDIIFVAILLIALFLGYRRGLLATVLILLGWLVAAFVIYTWNSSIAERIYHTAVEPWAVNKVASQITPEMQQSLQLGRDMLRSVQGVLDKLTGILGGQTVTPGEAGAIQAMQTDDYAHRITSTVLEPMLLTVIKVALGSVIFCLISGVFHFFADRSSRRRRGLLSTANHLLGAALGALLGFALDYAYVWVLAMISQSFQVDWLTEEILQGTNLVKLLL